MENLIRTAVKKKAWRAASNSATMAITLPASLMILHPEIKNTLYDVFFNLETNEIIYRPIPIKEGN